MSTKKDITKQNITSTIDSLIDIIINPNNTIESTTYNFKTNKIKHFIISLYIFKLIINKEEYIKEKYHKYLNNFNKEEDPNLEYLLNIKQELQNNNYYYNETDGYIYCDNDIKIDTKWLIPLIIMLLDKKSDKNILKEINICYTIPNKDINKLDKINNLENYLEQYTYYSIKITHQDNTKLVKENNILILKNAAINYLKHLKQFKHGLESKETYKIFYNLLKNECNKQGFILTEEETPLLEEPNKISIIEQYIDKQFTTYSSNKQSHIIENIIWQSSNDINLLEQINTSIDSVVDLISILHEESHKKTYKEIKDYHTIKDIQILSILLVLKFINTYYLQEELDYSLIDLTKITPKYMSIICDEEEQELKTKIKQLDKDLTYNKEQLSIAKEERTKINKEDLKEKYNSELERCVSNINKYSINIGTINNQLSTLSRRYEEIKKEQRTKYKNIELYHYNNSIIKHMINSILSCSFYLKTNNNTQLLSNIIILEDYYKTENAFYAEIPFSDLIRISNNNIIKRITDNIDLPKLIEE